MGAKPSGSVLCHMQQNFSRGSLFAQRSRAVGSAPGRGEQRSIAQWREHANARTVRCGRMHALTREAVG
jgi:hypothetical protein